MLLLGFPDGSVVKNPPENAEDSGLIPDLGTSHEAAKPTCRNYSACAPEPRSRDYRSLCPLPPVLHSERSHSNEEARPHSW